MYCTRKKERKREGERRKEMPSTEPSPQMHTNRDKGTKRNRREGARAACNYAMCKSISLNKMESEVREKKEEKRETKEKGEVRFRSFRAKWKT
jgi:hypothetical protein